MLNTPIMFRHLITLIGGLLLSIPATLGRTFVEKASIAISNAAFTSIIENPNDGSKLDLTVSTFNPLPLTKDDAMVIRDVGGQLVKNGADGLNAEGLASGLIWPNEIESVADDVFGTNGYWWVANGFLVPTKEAGSIGLIEAASDTSTTPATVHDLTSQLTAEKWWYHRVYFVDIDGDGRKDMLTARADTSGTTTQAEMVYFQHPLRNPITTRWEVGFLFNGPDALFRYEEIPLTSSTTRHAIFSTQYFAEKLVASWTDSDGILGKPDFKNMNHRVIEDLVDNRYFDSELVDVNGDGKLDLIVSVNSKTNGKLLVFEIPSDWATGTWTKHLIADGFKPPGLVITEGMGSPGTTFTFKPDGKARNKPLIMLTGDDDSNIYVFEAQSDMNTSDWSYTKTSIFQAQHGTVGAPTVRDVDGDGNVEVFVPAYSDGSLHVLSYVP